MTSHHDTVPQSRLPYTGPCASYIAKRIHGWSWQAFPIGMGTGASRRFLARLRINIRQLGAVYLTLANLHNHPPWVTHLEVRDLASFSRVLLILMPLSNRYSSTS